MTTSPTFYFNGIDGGTGNYWLAPCRLETFRGQLNDAALPVGSKKLTRRDDPRDLARVGWGVVWPAEADPRIRQALAPLLEWRSQALGRPVREFQAFPGQTCEQFRALHGMGAHTLDPHAMPYHLLLVAGPQEIDFEFQSALASSHSVGRLAFDHIEDLQSYVTSLIRYEQNAVTAKASLALVGTSHREDPLTQSAVEQFVKKLDGVLPTLYPDWQVHTLLRQAPTKQQLMQLLSRANLPSVLFTAGHGLGFEPWDPRHKSHQGALLCADFPGVGVWDEDEPIPDEMMLSAGDIHRSLDLSGLVCCHFACYSLGTRQHALYDWTRKEQKAEQPFVSQLPQKLLARGALAVVGHVGINLEQSYYEEPVGSQTTTFRGLLDDIMAGDPVGHALDHLHDRKKILADTVVRYMNLSDDKKDVASEIRQLNARLALEDARFFLLLGDPAARLNPTTA